MNAKKIVTGIAAIAVVGIVGASCSGTSTVEGTAVPVSDALEFPTIDGVEFADTDTTYTAPTATADPYSNDGTWLIPEEILPGDYKVTPDTSSWRNSGYWELCADLACEIDMDGSDYTGMIQNGAVTGQGYVTIPEYAVAITLDNVTLTPIGGK